MYKLQIININNIYNMQEYAAAIAAAPVITFNTFKEACNYIGFRPARQRCGYASIIGNNEFIITKEV